jgi:hypothetical protein
MLRKALFATSILTIGCGIAFVAPLSAQDSKPLVIHESHHDISMPLREMAPIPPRASSGREIEPLRRRPSTGREALEVPDGAVQSLPGPDVKVTNRLNFDGISANGSAPPDTNGSVGATQFVQIVNTAYAVYDKGTGGLLLGPLAISTIWQGFSGDCAAGDGGDPVVLYDKGADRWLVSQLNIAFNAYCLAVSTGSDATGSYARYEFAMFGNKLPDYPKLGVWPDAYYWSANIFGNGAAEACAFDRSSMLTGGSASAICFKQKLPVFSLLPSDLDGSTQPPAGEPAFFVDLSPPSTLKLFKFHVDFTTPANSTFTGPTLISVAPFSLACHGGGTCIPQQGTKNVLDSLGDRLMFRLAYRNLGTSENLLVNHSVKAGQGTSNQTGVRWYLIQDPNGTPAVAQQGTFAPGTTTYRWMGSIAMDKLGDIAVGYSASSKSRHPSIRFTGRIPTDPANTLELESTVFEGAGSQTGGLNRWGDYSSMSIDPVDDCTFWYTTEYIPTNGSFNWQTRIAAFKFNTCH